ncbi:hypothetical protein G6F62_015440 [Rhizopus arrhizus]|uniref:Uncharacterized protein n=1 Tax=Rhizopus delemar TaxID=936053 RepID=A0A9P6XN85_9FUNG|nr:hypothetical protein G6F22_020675 [Rhizopus arrhizus]KAG0919579.1 hypothetical protein G6F31_021060 [Rhizopus arrhizus]KAG1168221.1 hypothetical protein G6F35_017503 [Rhizopus arrhizus]KAG1306245.1 hypothetical protein G6F62_015440 [Rhizopus arrhizus]KAG1528359.1 hypothetical protein G6F50_018252 [Rhizopus delemar]
MGGGRGDRAAACAGRAVTLGTEQPVPGIGNTHGDRGWPLAGMPAARLARRGAAEPATRFPLADAHFAAIAHREYGLHQ